jgi:hypothetical protein
LPTDNVLPLLVEGAMANQYIRDLSSNVKRGQKSKVERGLFPACAPYSYKNVGKYKGEKSIAKDETIAPNLQILWDMLKTGEYQLADLFRIMESTYPLYNTKGKTLGSSSFYRIFHNPFYSGVFQWGKKEYLGVHESYLRQSEFKSIQNFLNKKDKTRECSLDFEFKGLFKCGCCDAYITAERKHKFVKSIQKHKDYEYYKCAHHRRHIKCEEPPLSIAQINAQIKAKLNEVYLPSTLDSLCSKNKIYFLGKHRIQVLRK